MNRVLHVLGSLGTGGVETNLLSLTPALRDHGYESELWSYNGGVLEPEFRRVMSVVHRPDRLSSIRALRVPQIVSQVAAIVRDRDISVVSAPHLWASFFAGLAAQRTGRPSVPHLQCAYWFTARDFPGFRGYPLHRRALFTLVYRTRLSTHVIAASRAHAGRMLERGVVPGRISIIPNCVDFPAPESIDPVHAAKAVAWPRGEFRCLLVGRLIQQKAHENFLLAMASLQRRASGVCGVVVGDGPLRSELEASCNQKGLCDRVGFAGVRREIPQIMSAADVLVLPSVWEINPVVVIEAMSMGLPVIGTDIQGTSELVQHGVTGLLVTPNDPEALAGAILRLSHDRPFLRRLGENALLHARTEHSPDRIAGRVSEAYDQARNAKATVNRVTLASLQV